MLDQWDSGELRVSMNQAVLRYGHGILVRGDGEVTPAIWRTEMLSLVEDVLSAVLGPSEVEAALRWVARRALYE